MSDPRTLPHDQSNGTKGKKRIDPLTRYVVAPNGCWLWQGRISEQGYGMCWTGGAHRYFYRKLVGEIPDGMHLDHICHDPAACKKGKECPHRRCVNPKHLKVVTPRENVQRSNSITAANAAATHCPRGHAYAGDNLTAHKKQRGCRECMRRAWGAFHERQRNRIARAGELLPLEARVLQALQLARTDQEVSELLGVSRQTVCVARGALFRGGLVAREGAKETVPGRRPAVLWRAS